MRSKRIRVRLPDRKHEYVTRAFTELAPSLQEAVRQIDAPKGKFRTERGKNFREGVPFGMCGNCLGGRVEWVDAEPIGKRLSLAQGDNSPRPLHDRLVLIRECQDCGEFKDIRLNDGTREGRKLAFKIRVR